MSLEEPEIIKQGKQYGVKLKANAPSLHIIKADISTEVSPIVGSEKQSEELVNYLLSEFESDPIKIWESNIFGKNLHELVNEGLQNKLYKMPEDAQGKLQETLERIVNEGSRRINLYYTLKKRTRAKFMLLFVFLLFFNFMYKKTI